MKYKDITLTPELAKFLKKHGLTRKFKDNVVKHGFTQNTNPLDNINKFNWAKSKECFHHWSEFAIMFEDSL